MHARTHTGANARMHTRTRERTQVHARAAGAWRRRQRHSLATRHVLVHVHVHTYEHVLLFTATSTTNTSVRNVCACACMALLFSWCVCLSSLFCMSMIAYSSPQLVPVLPIRTYDCALMSHLLVWAPALSLSVPVSVVMSSCLTFCSAPSPAHTNACVSDCVHIFPAATCNQSSACLLPACAPLTFIRPPTPLLLLLLHSFHGSTSCVCRCFHVHISVFLLSWLSYLCMFAVSCLMCAVFVESNICCWVRSTNLFVFVLRRQSLLVSISSLCFAL